MSISLNATEKIDNRASRFLYERLKLYFALLTALGGLILSTSSDSHTTPLIAIFFAIFGYIFVDRLRILALPPIAAYSAMAVTAIYCTIDFYPFHSNAEVMRSGGNKELMAVAQLLVMVQAILMLQKKNRRIFEQLGVFCLLDLIVAAVFNQTISFGLLLIPVCLIAAFALSLLAVASASEGLGTLEQLADPGSRSAGTAVRGPRKTITATSADAVNSLTAASYRLPLLALLSVGPSVLLFAAIFFYALPRTTDAVREPGKGSALVGFSDQVNLKQIGSMLENPAIALRAKITNSKTEKSYQLISQMYLRGRVLERYSVMTDRRGKDSASWNSIPVGQLASGQSLPDEFNPPRKSDTNFYDVTNFQITCNEMRSPSLFVAAPYHRRNTNGKVAHIPDRWTLVRKSKTLHNSYPRIQYEFSSNAFKNGIQSDLISRFAIGDSALQPSRSTQNTDDAANSLSKSQLEDYEISLLEYDIDAIPSAAALSEPFTVDNGGKRPNDYTIAKSMERFLATSSQFSYTLDLNAESLAGLDPIEQFLAVDKRGHCQYFAAALAMMLRSQGIHARLVVGYKTEEYNDLANQYIARQLHAHAWVEALIDSDQLNPTRNVYGQPKSRQYWLRLDPTPSSALSRRRTTRVGQVIDVAQNAWEDYVIDMDRTRQQTSLIGGAIPPMNDSYGEFVVWLSNIIKNIRAGNFGQGALASGTLFSWPAAIVGFMLMLVVVTLLRVPLPKWIRRRLDKQKERNITKPSVEFYARALDQLGRLGIQRAASQTPAELVSDLNANPPENASADETKQIAEPLRFLTTQFYASRFGARPFLNRSMQPHLDPNSLFVDAPSQRESIDLALNNLTEQVDRLITKSSRTKPTT